MNQFLRLAAAQPQKKAAPTAVLFPSNPELCPNIGAMIMPASTATARTAPQTNGFAGLYGFIAPEHSHPANDRQGLPILPILPIGLPILPIDGFTVEFTDPATWPDGTPVAVED